MLTKQCRSLSGDLHYMGAQAYSRCTFIGAHFTNSPPKGDSSEGRRPNGPQIKMGPKMGPKLGKMGPKQAPNGPQRKGTPNGTQMGPDQ